MTTDLDDVSEEGERLVLATDAREAGSAAFDAALKHRSMLVSEVVVAAFVLAFASFSSLALAILGLACVGFLEVLRRRAWSDAARAEALAEELAEVLDASDRPPGHPTT